MGQTQWSFYFGQRKTCGSYRIAADGVVIAWDEEECIELDAFNLWEKPDEPEVIELESESSCSLSREGKSDEVFVETSALGDNR